MRQVGGKVDGRWSGGGRFWIQGAGVAALLPWAHFEGRQRASCLGRVWNVLRSQVVGMVRVVRKQLVEGRSRLDGLFWSSRECGVGVQWS